MKKFSVLKPKKYLGQVFLTDQHIIKKIISSCRLTKADTVLEIGPGQGALTHLLADNAKEVLAIETDRRFVEKLEKNFKNKNATILHNDFLKFDIEKLPSDLIVVGNLPYYISSPIIQKLIEARQHFRRLFLTVQLEFGKRMIAKPHTKDYSALTCFVEYYSDAKMLFQIKRGSFSPQPKVDSCLMELNLRPEPLLKAGDETLLFKIIHLAFQQRRKTLPNTLAPFIKKEGLYPILDALEINPRLRPENLNINDFVRLTNAIKK